ncbi:hypothetical protein F5146DRAFT_532274 [Armillaria mellea]|nr:hypothetical protein F5146DRAFT_532274 [Armillaria mellea]
MYKRGAAGIGWRLTLDEETLPKLSAYAVATIGYSAALDDAEILFRDLREEDLRKHIMPREVKHPWCDPVERQAQIGFLDIWQALWIRQQIFSHSYFKEVGLSYDQRDEDQYLFPDWYSQEDVDLRNVERAVRMSNVTSFDMDGTTRGRVREFESSGAHHTLFYSFYLKKNVI